MKTNDKPFAVGMVDEHRKLAQVTAIIDSDHFQAHWKGQIYEARAFPDTGWLTVGDNVVCHALPGNTELVTSCPLRLRAYCLVSDNAGVSKVYKTETLPWASPVWEDRSAGLPATSYFVELELDPFDKRIAYVSGPSGIYKNTNIREAAPGWTQILSKAQFDAMIGFTTYNFYVRDIEISEDPAGEQYLWALITFDHDTQPFFDAVVAHTHDRGITWAISNRLEGLAPGGWIVSPYGGLEVSHIDMNYVWVVMQRAGGAAGASRFYESLNHGHLFSYKSICGFYADGNVDCHCPRDNNASNLILWVFGATRAAGFPILAYSTDRGATWAERSDGTARGDYSQHAVDNLIVDRYDRSRVYVIQSGSPAPPTGWLSLNEGLTWPAMTPVDRFYGFDLEEDLTPYNLLGGSRVAAPDTVGYVYWSNDDTVSWTDKSGNLHALFSAHGPGYPYDVWSVKLDITP